jgi:hypothetical protein
MLACLAAAAAAAAARRRRCRRRRILSLNRNFLNQLLKYSTK